MKKSEYLTTISDFIEYFAKIINGTAKVDHYYYNRDRRFTGDRNVSIIDLRDAFRIYEWARSKYDESNNKLITMKANYEADIGLAIDDDARDDVCLKLIENVMAWGFGVNRNPYKDNMKWATDRQSGLHQRIERGKVILEMDDPDTSEFATELKMNAGYTKVYALLCQRSIIYDGRVGAALGFLVRKYCIKFEQNRVPDALKFPWGRPSSNSKGFSRDPSGDGLSFVALSTNSKAHAEWNIRANWLIEAAIAKATANRMHEGASQGWWEGEDGMRKVEAALFMLGYRFDQGGL